MGKLTINGRLKASNTKILRSGPFIGPFPSYESCRQLIALIFSLVLQQFVGSSWRNELEKICPPNGLGQYCAKIGDVKPCGSSGLM